MMCLRPSANGWGLGGRAFGFEAGLRVGVEVGSGVGGWGVTAIHRHTVVDGDPLALGRREVRDVEPAARISRDLREELRVVGIGRGLDVLEDVGLNSIVTAGRGHAEAQKRSALDVDLAKQRRVLAAGVARAHKTLSRADVHHGPVRAALVFRAGVQIHTEPAMKFA